MFVCMTYVCPLCIPICSSDPDQIWDWPSVEPLKKDRPGECELIPVKGEKVPDNC